MKKTKKGLEASTLSRSKRPINQKIFLSVFTILTSGWAFSDATNTFPASGNVGIGTSTPSNALDVKGTIRAEEVVVQTGWSDFVFENDYNFRTLDEVAGFIAENGHLPEIPSAEEVDQNGVTLGQMNAKLLQKLEEMTLYLLDLQDQNRDLVERVQKLEACR